MNYQVNEFGQLESTKEEIEDVQEELFKNISLMYEMNKNFFRSQDHDSLKIVVVTIMKSI